MRGLHEPSRVDILLMLLLAGGLNQEENEPIIGKTRLQKELFLSQKALKAHPISHPYSFRPYRYGPYCKDIYNDIEWYKNKGLIQEDRMESLQTGVILKFLLTEQGITDTKKLIEQLELEKQFQIISEVKKKYNSMDVVDLVEFTHQEYPEYDMSARF